MTGKDWCKPVVVVIIDSGDDVHYGVEQRHGEGQEG